jgi:hypothetical protein
VGGLSSGCWWVRAQFFSGSRHLGLEMGVCMDEGLILLRVKACQVQDGVLGEWRFDFAQGQGMWCLGLGFGLVRDRFVIGSRCVRHGLVLLMGECSSLLKVKACRAWDGVLGK